jgi:hypothetical protein
MQTTGIIGLSTDELHYVRTLIRIMRLPDPMITELARQAIAYLELVETRTGSPKKANGSCYE